MKIKITASFRDKLNEQIDYIARDKPSAARKFKTELLPHINYLSRKAYQNRKSIFFDREDIHCPTVSIRIFKVNYCKMPNPFFDNFSRQFIF